jgi:uncharacterized protein (DUF362 family)
MEGKTDVFIADSSDRSSGLKAILAEYDLSVFSGVKVALKANFNSDDAFPASSHIDTMRGIVEAVLKEKPAHITLAERSGMGNTKSVLEFRGVTDLAKELDFPVVVLDEIDRTGWQEVQSAGLHWSRGFFIAKLFTQADRVIQTCCLKTHRYGGHFTMSLKNSVGLVAKRVPGVNYDFMGELHSSPYQRKMIAEINKFYSTDMVIMDATEGFSTGGPDTGKLIHPNVIIGGRDRIAIDATGVALLRSYGTSHDVSEGKIFGLEQIERAAELGVGISSPDKIHLVPLDKKAEPVAQKIQDQLDKET